jgi:hypothetical protein
MQASHIVRASLVASLAFALTAGAVGCHAEAKVKASTQEPEERTENVTTAAPTPAPAPAAPTPPPAPRSDACPLTCFESRGPERAVMTNEEHTQLRSALEPVLGRMRACTSDEEWRRYGSPVINLRLAPDGTLAELGVDPHHGHDSDCFDQVGRGANASVTLPGRKVVRCSEHCARDTGDRGRRGRGRGRR